MPLPNTHISRRLVFDLAVRAAVAGVTGRGVARAATRPMAGYPQPVRVGDLAGRYLLEANEAERVLGHVVGLFREADGRAVLLVWRGGFLGLGAVLVAVPLSDVALLGEHIALLGLSTSAYSALPRAARADYRAFPPDDKMLVAITGPFH